MKNGTILFVLFVMLSGAFLLFPKNNTITEETKNKFFAWLDGAQDIFNPSKAKMNFNKVKEMDLIWLMSPNLNSEFVEFPERTKKRITQLVKILNK